MKAVIYLEGGGESKELNARCREGFRKLLEKCGFRGRMPRLVACGSRGSVFDDFRSAHTGKRSRNYALMLIDSEDPLTVLNAAWEHLKKRDGWDRPNGAKDEQVLFMTTCMETWIVVDRDALKMHYGSSLQDSALPALNEIEKRSRHDIQGKLIRATRQCPNAYSKGKKSFEVLAKIRPEVLRLHLPSFVRALDILNEKL